MLSKGLRQHTWLADIYFGVPIFGFSILMSYQRFLSSSLPQGRCIERNEIIGHLCGLVSALLILESILDSLVSFELLLVRSVVIKLFRQIFLFVLFSLDSQSGLILFMLNDGD